MNECVYLWIFAQAKPSQARQLLAYVGFSMLLKSLNIWTALCQSRQLPTPTQSCQLGCVASLPSSRADSSDLLPVSQWRVWCVNLILILLLYFLTTNHNGVNNGENNGRQWWRRQRRADNKRMWHRVIDIASVALAIDNSLLCLNVVITWSWSNTDISWVNTTLDVNMYWNRIEYSPNEILPCRVRYHFLGKGC